MMTLDGAAEWALFILLFFVVFFALTTVGLLAALAIGLKVLNAKIEQALEAVKPVIVKSTDVLDTVQRVTMNVGEKADSILSQGEDLTEKLSKKVDHTASVVEKTVTTPLINFSAMLAGISKGFDTLNKGANSNGIGGSSKV